MIDKLKIERFKSIRSLELECKRINLFIGEPNVGKSNILEALGLLSWCASTSKSLKEFVRFQLTQQLFYDSLTDEPIRIAFHGKPNGAVTVKFENEHFDIALPPDGALHARLDFNGGQPVQRQWHEGEAFRFYRFRMLEKFDSASPGPLIPPDGRNLFSVAYGSKDMREWLVDLYRPYGLAVVMKPHERMFELQKHQDGVVTAYPYTMSSDTLQRVLFFHAAMASNRDAVLIFEEPEAHAFPYYTKHLGETIGLGDTNQYFVATHNPYLLSAIVEKAPKEDVAVFVTSFRDFATQAKRLTDEEVSRLLDADPFLGLELILDKGASV